MSAPRLPLSRRLCLAGILGVLAVLAAPRSASAQSTDASLVAETLDEVIAMGATPAPAFGIAAPLYLAQLATSAHEQWFDPGWAAVEVALGTAGSAYATWWLSSTVASDPGWVTQYTSSYALAMNLRLVTHGLLSMALYSDAVDPRVATVMPMITVSPVEGGAMGTAAWSI